MCASVMICPICEKEKPKYKCPKCSKPYCSLPCYKVHTEIPCEDTELEAAARDDDPATREKESEEPTLHAPFSTEDTVQREQLEKLGKSEGLRDLLYNPHLRNLLIQVDSATNAAAAMRAAMQEPLFVEFADECLKVLEPMSATDQF